MERLIERLARRLRARPGRRLVPDAGARGRPDLRASYRRALATGGRAAPLLRAGPRAAPSRAWSSCATPAARWTAHTRFLLTFALAVRRALPRAEVFAFNTELVHLTARPAPGKLPLTLDRLAAAVPDWSGGTRIGDCLATFVERHLPRLVDRAHGGRHPQRRPRPRRPGPSWPGGRADPRRARALIWLNPLLGDPRYQPLAAGMQAALPFIDHFAAAHDLESLERLIPHLHPSGLNMGFSLEHAFVVKAPADRVWAFLTDPTRVASALPGAAITEKVGDDSYTRHHHRQGRAGRRRATTARVRFEALDAAARTAKIVGSGQDTSGRGGADLRMSSRLLERSPEETEVSLTSEVNVTGILAQFGRGMIQDVSNQMVGRFTEAMRAQLESRPAARPPAPARPRAGQRRQRPASTAATAASAAVPPAAAGRAAHRGALVRRRRPRPGRPARPAPAPASGWSLIVSW